MVSGPGAEEGEQVDRAAANSPEVSEVQSANGRRMKGRDLEGCGGKKWLRSASLICVGVVASGTEGKRGASFPKDNFLTVHMDRGVAEASRDLQ